MFRFDKATRMSNPRPPPPISPAMITTASTIMIVWFTPSRIDGRARGNWTFRSSCRFVDPIRLGRLHRLLRHTPDAVVREPDTRPAARRSRRRSPPAPARERRAAARGRGRRTPASSASRRAQAGSRARTRRCERRATPIGIAITIAISDRDQHQGERLHRRGPTCPAAPMPKMHRNEKTARRTPDTFHAITAAAPATIHHGTPTSRSCERIEQPNAAGTSEIQSATPVRLSRDHSTIAFAGVATEVVHASGHSCCRSTSRPITTAPIDRGDRRDPHRAAGESAPGDLDAVVGGVPPLTPGRRHPVEHDGHHHDRDAAVQRLADVELLEAVEHLPAEARRPDDGRDHDHAERHHDRLVDPEHHRRLGERDLHLRQGLPRRRPEGVGDLERGRRHVADAHRREPNRGWQGEDHGRDQGGRAPMPKSSTHGSRYEYAGIVCIASRNARRPRSTVGLRPAQMPSGMPITSETTDRDEHEGERLDAVLPHTEQPERGDARGGEQGQSPAGDHAGDPARRDREAQPRHAVERVLDPVDQRR